MICEAEVCASYIDRSAVGPVQYVSDYPDGEKRGKKMSVIKATIHNRGIDVPAPSDIPDGAEVTVTIDASENHESEPMSPEEIARILSAMQKLEPLEIPEEVAAELDAWERRANQRGIDHRDSSASDWAE